MREQSHRAKSKKKQEIMDINTLEVEKRMNLSETDTIIHGHTHKPGSYTLPSGKTRIVLPDWRLIKGELSGGGLLLNSSGAHHLPL